MRSDSRELWLTLKISASHSRLKRARGSSRTSSCPRSCSGESITRRFPPQASSGFYWPSAAPFLNAARIDKNRRLFKGKKQEMIMVYEHGCAKFVNVAGCAFLGQKFGVLAHFDQGWSLPAKGLLDFPLEGLEAGGSGSPAAEGLA